MTEEPAVYMHTKAVEGGYDIYDISLVRKDGTGTIVEVIYQPMHIDGRVNGAESLADDVVDWLNNGLTCAEVEEKLLAMGLQEKTLASVIGPLDSGTLA